MTALEATQRGDAVRIAVHVKPRSSRSVLLAVREDGGLAVALKAPPVDGAANAELVKLLSRAFDVRKANVTIAAGQSGRRKLVDIAGIDVSTLRRLVAEAV